MTTWKKGSFEYLEAKIRHDTEGTLFGRDFEWVCKWFLENAPEYRGKFRHVWLWADWPDRWGPDCGIDLIAETREGHLWAIQAKATAPTHTVTKSEVDSFLAESNHRKISFRLLIATTDSIGTNARRTVNQQAKPASFLGRGDLVAAGLFWPAQVGGKTPRLKRAKPRPHQRAAINAVVRGFRDHDRGRLIMACGTGKTLTGLWIHERLKSKRTLLLVPSISLVQQNLREWGKHAKDDFDCLVVCSDESVARGGGDPALRYVTELGTEVTTDPASIASFLAKRRQRPAVLIATYHSSDRVSAAQKRARRTFDLAMCDEAHRLAGDAKGKFAVILDNKRIRASRRLFMTATPRYFTQKAKNQAADGELELASMDDVSLFGQEFHVLNFSAAINAKPEPLLTDYRVVIIGVTDSDAKRLVDKRKLLRTKSGATADARTLACQIGLAKAITDYDLRRVITFHRSIKRASQFVDSTIDMSLPRVFETLKRRSHSFGKIWARHISGATPASQRATLLRTLADLPTDTRGVVANCACLGEGVDVPALDGIAFIDPKGSMIDIIQAVGRVIRLSPDKKIGTIIIPVFCDASISADQSLNQSAFSPAWQILKALRAHDQRLADELDALREHGAYNDKASVILPANIYLEIPTELPENFSDAFFARLVEATTQKPPLTIESILAWADSHYQQTGMWPRQNTGPILGTEETWSAVNHALDRGHRGLSVKNYSLAQLLEDYRGVRNRRGLKTLTEDQILELADQHHRRTGRWPNRDSGDIDGTEDSWSSICVALRNGARGLPRKITLADLLFEKRQVPNKANRPALTDQQVLEWADRHKLLTGEWPDQTSGPVDGENENWRGINSALSKGLRGFPGGSSIHQVLEAHGRIQRRFWDPSITVEDILFSADRFFARHKRWPKRTDIEPAVRHFVWTTVDNQLRQGWENHSPGGSLALLLMEHRGYRHHLQLDPLSPEKIIDWAQEYHESFGRWPTSKSGDVPGTTENWRKIDAALKQGHRGLTKGDSLAKLLSRKLGVHSRQTSPRLSVKRILHWCDIHKSKYGCFPTVHDARGPREGETWLAINASLERGNRGLPGGTSLAALLAEHRSHARGRHSPRLTIAMVVDWAKRHHKATGRWPTQQAIPIAGTDERWDNIAQCIRLGLRGFPEGWTLRKILDAHCR